MSDYELNRRGFDPPTEIAARPFGAPKIVEQPIFEPEQEPPPLLTEDQITDKLDQIARLLRSLTCEEMWKLTEGLNKPGMEKDLINWAKVYMGETVVKEAPTKLVRRV